MSQYVKLVFLMGITICCGCASVPRNTELDKAIKNRDLEAVMWAAYADTVNQPDNPMIGIGRAVYPSIDINFSGR